MQASQQLRGLEAGATCTASKMSKKKQQRNGFFYFMLDMQQELRERGRNVPMHSMSAIAGPKWATMSDAQRQAYNHRAKMEKASARGTGATTNPALMPPIGTSVPRYERMDSTGQKLSVSLFVQPWTDVVVLQTLIPVCAFRSAVT